MAARHKEPNEYADRASISGYANVNTTNKLPGD
jgi:hypothetical protein